MRTARGSVVIASLVAVSMVSLLGASGASGSTMSRKLWSARYDGKAHLIDQASWDALSPDGSTLYVTGRSAGANGDDYVTLAYSTATGEKLWKANYDGSAHVTDDGMGVVASPDGSAVFVTGTSAGDTTGSDYATVAYDAGTGAQLWATRYDGPGHGDDSTISIGMSSDGSDVFVTGDSIGKAGDLDFATVAYDTSTGDRAWVARYDGPGHGEDSPGALTVGPDGTVYVMGGSLGDATGFDVATVAYAGSTGKRKWLTRYDGPTHGDDGNCIWTCIETSPDGSQVFVLANTTGANDDIVTLAYKTKNGKLDWSEQYDGPGKGNDAPGDLAVLPDGSAVVITGGEVPDGSPLQDIVTISYATSNGDQQWVREYDGASHGDDFPNTIAATPDSGKVVLTGATNENGSSFPTGYDVVTIAYETANGHREWTQRYDGPGHARDFGVLVVISPDGGTAYTAGASLGTSASLDYVTIAYRAD